MKVHLVDGTYELFRAYYGAPSASDASGREVGATRGLLRSIAAFLREPGVTHVAVAFDHVIESFRNELFDGYKTGEGIEPELREQFPLAEHAMQALGVVTWPMVEFEADDALATGAARYSAEPEVEQVVLCSPDKDLAQCVRGERVVCLDRMRQKLLDEPSVIEKFGVQPASIPDYLALVGDTADGIPGVPRWGAKSAGQVLMHYGRLEAIPDLVDTWAVTPRGAKALAESLNQHKESALLYRRLATLAENVPLEEDLTALEWRGAPRQLLAEFSREIGEDRLLERVAFRD